MEKIELLRRDFLGKGECEVIPQFSKYTGGQPIHVAKASGMVFVRERRPPLEIAKSWSDDVFGADISQSTYTARHPIMKARHVFVADFTDSNFPLKGKKIVDIGAGEGQFLEIAGSQYGAIPFGIEPSKKNCQLMEKRGIENFAGTIEDYAASSKSASGGQFDFATMMWTLCNVGECLNAVTAAYNALKENGILVVAESSRILVPFKKPLHTYVNPQVKTDLHPWHFSGQTLCTLLEVAGFELQKTNRFFEQDNLVVIAMKKEKPKQRLFVDDYRQVLSFFERWDAETQHFKHFDYNYSLL